MAETTHTGTEVPAGAEGKVTFPPFQSDTFATQVIWLAIAFGLLYLLMSRLALPRVSGILEDRGRSIADDLKAAQRMKDESDAAAIAYETSLAEARTKAQAIAAQTHEAVNAETEATRKSLDGDLGRRLTEAEAQIAAKKTAALGNVRSIAREAAASIVERLTGRRPDDEAVASAVDAVVDH